MLFRCLTRWTRLETTTAAAMTPAPRHSQCTSCRLMARRLPNQKAAVPIAASPASRERMPLPEKIAFHQRYGTAMIELAIDVKIMRAIVATFIRRAITSGGNLCQRCRMSRCAGAIISR